MSYDPVLSIRVPVTVHARLRALADERGLNVSELIRLVLLDALGRNEFEQSRKDEAIEQILFLAMAADNFLAAQPDQTLRNTTIQMWHDRLAEERQRHA